MCRSIPFASSVYVLSFGQLVDEREDDGYNGGYEDECFECLDF